MLLDPQATAGLLAAILLAFIGKVYQLSSKQGRALRKARRRAELLEAHVFKCHRVMRQNGIEPPRYTGALAYMAPESIDPDEIEEDDEDDE